jgi:hypothetical protein
VERAPADVVQRLIGWYALLILAVVATGALWQVRQQRRRHLPAPKPPLP